MRAIGRIRGGAWRGFAALAFVAACGLPACRSADSATSRSSDPVSIDVGAGDAAAVARRAALELADAAILVGRAPRVGGQDRRYVLRFDAGEDGAQPAFRTLLQDALVGTGRFLVVGEGRDPAIRARVSAAGAGSEARIEFLGPDGDLWAEAHGRLLPAN